ncbi:MAG: phasin family protein [Rickettsiales bacterium]|nr:phasin family protein [Rickettsiales bacterium]
MAQPTKKSPTAKLATETSKAAKATFANMETGRASAENVVKIGGKAVKDFMSTSAYDAKAAQEKVFAMGREGSEQLVKSADAITKIMYEAITMGRDNVETAIECGNLTAALAKDLSTELFETGNRAFSDNLELSKEFFSCRTFNDMFELQNRIMKTTLDTFFNESVKLSGMVFEYTTEALEPINDRMSQASEQISKALSA